MDTVNGALPVGKFSGKSVAGSFIEPVRYRP